MFRLNKFWQKTKALTVGKDAVSSLKKDNLGLLS